MENSEEIRVLDPVDAVRLRPGMYIGGVQNADVLLKECWDNCQDECTACKTCNNIIIDEDFNGYKFCADQGRGISIRMSKDKVGQTECDCAASYTHSGSKFDATTEARVGQNGIGIKATNFCSEEFIILSRVTPDNYNQSLPIVEKAWNKCGVRKRKELYYIIAFRKGRKFYESADLLENIENMIFGKENNYVPFPRDFSTLVMFKPDPEIFESTEAKIPFKSIQYFLLIQEKLYKRKIEVIANKEPVNGTFKPYKFELFKTIYPKDTSKNPSVSVYVTFEVDPELGPRKEEGSVSGLVVDQGVHITYMEECYKQALINEFKIKHSLLLNGLQMIVILIAGDTVYSSQTKERLKSISKVKLSDFGDVVKEFQKIFRNNQEYWQEHVSKLDFLAQSMRSLSSEEKINKMIEESQGNAYYKTKNTIVEGYAAATAGPNDRWNCSIYLCEGLSPFGSLKNSRLDIKHQACLALRGKVKGLAKYSDYDKGVESLLENREYFSIFKLIGLGVGKTSVINGCKTKEEAYEKVRKYAKYGSIIIATDSDEDGLGRINII